MTKVSKVKGKKLAENTVATEEGIVEVKKKKSSKPKKLPPPEELLAGETTNQDMEVSEETVADGKEEEVKKPRTKRKHLTPVEKAIVEEQNKHGENDIVFRKTPFERLIREILTDPNFVDDNGEPKRLAKDAIVALKYATEQFLLECFVSAKDIKDFVTPKIQTLDSSHFLMATKLSGQENVTHFCNDRISKFNIHRQAQTEIRKAQIRARNALLKSHGGKKTIVMKASSKSPRKPRAPRKKPAASVHEESEQTENTEVAEQDPVDAETNNDAAEEMVDDILPQPAQEYVEAE